MHDHDEIYDRGLQFDLSTLLARRRVLGLFAAAGAGTLVGCADDSGSAGTGSTSTGATPGSVPTGDCAPIPQETAGPYPGDGSNGPNILTQSGIVRSDIRASFGSASGIAAGVPLTINLTLLDTSNGCAALPGAAVYLWQCDRAGGYSMYSPGITAENYLRGVPETDAAGEVGFTSIFPGSYSGRWPHLHFEVYPSLDAATAQVICGRPHSWPSRRMSVRGCTPPTGTADRWRTWRRHPWTGTTCSEMATTASSAPSPAMCPPG